MGLSIFFFYVSLALLVGL